jgi:uncharacterized membrane protein YesL
MAQHEFTAEQNRTFEALRAALIGFAGAIGTLAVLMVIYGLVGMSRGHLAGPVILLIIGSSAVALVLAWQFTRPLDNFRAITTTTGRDMSQLGTALDDLCQAHSVFVILVVMWLIVDVAGMLILRGN